MVVLLVVLGPLLIFMPQMIRATIKSVHDYGTFAVMRTQMFDGKWVQGDYPTSEPVLGTPDISSLADLGNAYEVLDRIRACSVMVLAALIPLAPLLLTVMPLGQLLELAGKVLV